MWWLKRTGNVFTCQISAILQIALLLHQLDDPFGLSNAQFSQPQFVKPSRTLTVLLLVSRYYNRFKALESKLEYHSQLFDQHSDLLTKEADYLDQYMALDKSLKHHDHDDGGSTEFVPTGDIANTPDGLIEQTRQIITAREELITQWKEIEQHQTQNGHEMLALEKERVALLEELDKAAMKLGSLWSSGSELYSHHEVDLYTEGGVDKKLVEANARVLLNLLEQLHNSSFQHTLDEHDLVSRFLYPLVSDAKILGIGSLRIFLRGVETNIQTNSQEILVKVTKVGESRKEMLENMVQIQQSIHEHLQAINQKTLAAARWSPWLSISIGGALGVPIIAYIEWKFGSYFSLLGLDGHFQVPVPAPVVGAIGAGLLIRGKCRKG